MVTEPFISKECTLMYLTKLLYEIVNNCNYIVKLHVKCRELKVCFLAFIRTHKVHLCLSVCLSVCVCPSVCVCLSVCIRDGSRTLVIVLKSALSTFSEVIDGPS